MDREYIYHSYTRSLCNVCDQLVDAKIVIVESAVWLYKTCPLHGLQKELIEAHAQYYLNKHAYDKPATISGVDTVYAKGCPFDCGLCPDHDQHTCIGLIEITQRCNLNCNGCYTKGDNGEDLTLETIGRMMDYYQQVEGNQGEILQISGGEPTLHPQILDILDMAMAKGFKFVMLNTNGLEFLVQPALLEKCRQFSTGFEVYLQFDGFDVDQRHRAQSRNLSVEKRKILDRLKEYKIPTTLVVTVSQESNLNSLGQIIQWAMDAPMVRGINFQPMAYYDAQMPAPKERVTLTSILTAIETQTSGLVQMSDFIPLPCNVERVAINYMIKERTGFTPVSKKLDLQTMVPAIKNTLSFKLEDVEATTAMCSCMKGIPKLSKLLPKAVLEGSMHSKRRFVDDQTFRLTVTSFIDRYNFDIKSAQKECVHIITPDLKRMPFSTYNILHRKRG